MLRVLSSSRPAAGALAASRLFAGFFRALRCAVGVAGSRARPAVFAALPAARRSDHYAGAADCCTGASAVHGEAQIAVGCRPSPGPA